MRFQKRRRFLYFIVVLLFFGILSSIAWAGRSVRNYSSGPVKVIYDYVGHYALNYTGNTNNYDYWNSTGTKKLVSRNYKDRGNLQSINNSIATISQSDSESSIKKAYLIWQSRSEEAPTTSIQFYTPSGVLANVTSDQEKVTQDVRTNKDGEEYVGVYVMVADVTDIVCSDAGGYGTYTVANIPIWDGVQEGEVVCGGESVASWQLVVVEESPDFPLRTISLNILSQYFYNIDYAVTVTFSDASSPNGDVSAQFLSGSVDVDSSYRYDGIGYPDDYNYEYDGRLYRYRTQTRGLYKNGVCFNNRDTGGVYGGARAVGGTRVHLFDDYRRLNGQLSQTTIYRWKDKNIGVNVFLNGVSIDVFAYDVVFDGNGADSGSMDSMTCIYGRGYNLSENQYSKAHYKFAGWNTEPDGSGTSYENGQYIRNLTSAEDKVTLYAQWEPDTYKITLDNQYADYAGSKAFYEWYSFGNYTNILCTTSIDKVTIPQKKGYTFNGYYTEGDGQGTKYVDSDGKILSTSTTFTGDTALYAYWTPNLYYVTFDPNGGIPGILTYIDIQYGSNWYWSHAGMVPSRAHHKFLGFFTEPDGGRMVYDSNGSCVNGTGFWIDNTWWYAGDVTLYAHWEADTYIISLDSQGANNVGSEVYYEKYGIKNYVVLGVVDTQSSEVVQQFNYTGGVQSFVAPYTGTYHLDVYGASGESTSYIDNDMVTGDKKSKSNAVPLSWSEGTINLRKGEILYIYVGGEGKNNIGGWNGGSAGRTFWTQYYPYYDEYFMHLTRAGGGATDIRLGGTELENRIIVAGGGAGGTSQEGSSNYGFNSVYGASKNVYFGFLNTADDTYSVYSGLIKRRNFYSVQYMLDGMIMRNGNNNYNTFFLLGPNQVNAGYVGTPGTLILSVSEDSLDGEANAVLFESNLGTLGRGVDGGGGGYYGGGSVVVGDASDFSSYMSSANKTGTASISLAASSGSSYVGGCINGKIYRVQTDNNIKNTKIMIFDENDNVVKGSNITDWGEYSRVWGNGYAKITYTNYIENEDLSTTSITIPQKDGYTFWGYYTGLNGTGTRYVDECGNILSTPTTFTSDTTLYAYWIPDSYTLGVYKVQFNGNGADSGTMPIMTCNFNQVYNLSMNRFSKKGHSFAGWSLSPQGGVSYSNGASINNLGLNGGDTVTLYAKWTPNAYSMILDHNGGMLSGAASNSYTVKYGYGDYWNISWALPTRPGYAFNGYYDSSGVKVFDAYGKCTNEGRYWKDNIWVCGSNATFYAGWTPNNYTMTLDHNNGTFNGASSNNYTMTYGSSDYSDMSWAIPIREDHTFNGYWTWDGTDVQIYDSNGYCTNDGIYWLNNNWNYAGNAAFYAKWIRNIETYTIYLDNQIADVSGTIEFYEKYSIGNFADSSCSTPITTIVIPQKAGYTFGGYYSDIDGNGTQYIDSSGAILSDATTFTSDTVLYAEWNPITYYIRFDSNGGSGTMADMTCLYGNSYTLDANIFIREGSKFVGWNTESDGTGITYTNKSTVNNLCNTQGGSITLYAQWTWNIYIIHFDANGGTGTMNDMECGFNINYKLEPNQFMRESHAFAGWSLIPDGSVDYADEAVVNNLLMTTGTVNLYAVWIPVYEITLDHQGADTTGTGQYFEKYNIGNYADAACTEVITNITIPITTGYTFEGYFTEQDGNGTKYVEADGTILSEPSSFAQDTTLYAYWTPVSYIIRFEGNGSAEGGMNDMVCSYDMSYRLEMNQFTRINHTYLGWNTESDGSGTFYADQSMVKNLTSVHGAVVTLYAQWKPNTYEVYFDANGGEGEMDVIALFYDMEQCLPANGFTKRNEHGLSTFLGWSTDASDTSAIFADEANVINLPGCEDGFLTLYAIWDDCPWIIAEDLYYSLYEAQNGLITYEELLDKAVAEDKEDGSPVLPGINTEKGTSFTIIDYLPTDFTQFTAGGSVTETYQVIDSAGNKFKKMITVHIVDTTPAEILPDGTTRFINEKYYNETYENGGLEEDSVWKTDPEFVEVIQEAFDNQKNNTPIMSFSFTYEEISEMKEFVRINGIGNSKSPDALQRFYDTFMVSNMAN